MKLFTPVLILLPIVGINAQVLPTQTSSISGTAMVSIEARDTYLTAMKKRIAINQREQDAFGLSQTPGTFVPDCGDHRRPNTPSFFSQAIQSLPVTGIIAGNKQFVIGAQTLKEGDTFPIRKGEKQVRVQVQQVNPTSIVFKDLANGEAATHRFDLGLSDKIEKDEKFSPEGVYSEKALPPVIIP